MEDWVLVDTVIWASFFSKPNSAEKRAVDDLIDADRVALVGPIIAEVLLGFRRQAQADWVASRLRLVHYVEPTWGDWKSAAEIGRTLAARGHVIPITDLVVAAVAQRTGISVYSTDPHFDLVPDLKRYWPPSQ
jgi:predicted nucleic acid-binding protein